MTKVIYAFSGDPITNGHIDIISRASKCFDKLVVGIGVNPDKKYMFTLDERLDMAKKCLSSFSNVEVVSFEGLLVDYAYEHGINAIIKGVRNATDFAYENDLHQVGESQGLKIETFSLFANPKFAHISSSYVKGIQKEQGLLKNYVPLYVKQYLEVRMSNQYIIGVTGEIGVGKSYVCERFIELGKDKELQVYNIDLDVIGHQILGDLKLPAYNNIRLEIAKRFGEDVRNKDGTINRKKLGNIVFNDSVKLNELNKIMETPLLIRLRKEIYGKKGLILINAALIAESNLSYLCNNNIIMVNADKEIQKSRLISRNLSSEQIKTRLNSQFDYLAKKNVLEKAISLDNAGKIWEINNSDNVNNIDEIFNKIISDLELLK